MVRRACRACSLVLAFVPILGAGCGPPSVPGREELAELFGASYRPAVVRLSGGFGHATCDVIASSEMNLVPDAVCSTKGEITENRLRRLLLSHRRFHQEIPSAVVHRAGDGPGPPSADFHAAGVVELLVQNPSHLDRGVELLERAAAITPENPELHNDLAVGYYLRAQAADRPFDFVRALEAVEQALEAGPEMAEALFNRALVLDALGLSSIAAAAWARHAEVETDPRWRQEAGSRAPVHESTETGSWTTYRQALAAGDVSVVDAAVTLDPGAVQELALSELLPDWAEALLGRDEATAAGWLDRLAAVGDALAAASGDLSVAGTVAAIRAPDGDPARAARACRAFGRGRRLFRESRYVEARSSLAAARRESGLGPLAAWAGFWLAGADLTANDYSGALRRVRALRSEAELGGLPSLAARLHWIQGLVELRTGLFAASRESFESAAEGFASIHYTTLAGAAVALSAESYRALGHDAEAWAQRFKALARLKGEPTSFLHNLLLDASAAARDLGLSRAAVTLQTAGVANAQALGSSTRTVEALLWRSKIFSAAGRLEEAAADVDQARQRISEVADPEVRRRLGADLGEVHGLLLLATDPPAAHEPLTQAIEAYGAFGYTFRLPRVYRSRAQSRLARGEVGLAEADLEAGIQEYERRDERLRGEIFRQEHFERAQELFDDRIELALETGQPIVALAFSERARMSTLRRVADAGRALRGEPFASGEAVLAAGALREAAGRLLPGVALVEYAVLLDFLSIWRIAGGQIDHWRLELPASDLRRRSEAFHSALAAGKAGEIDALAASLHRDLVAPVVAGLAPGTELVFVPDRALAKVPFAALKDVETGRYLIEDHAVSTSLGLGFFLGGGGPAPPRPPSPGTVLLVGDPETDGDDLGERLPSAAEEAGELARLYPGATLLTGAEAVEERVTAALAGARIFHYAGHGVSDDARPWASYLPLTPGAGGQGRLYAHELLGRRFPRLELVVLSACGSLGARGERVMATSGLSLAFLGAGVPAVVANLWDVDDEASRRLLVPFHRHLLAGDSAPRALRSAVLELLAASPRPSPTAWAALVAVTRQSDR